MMETIDHFRTQIFKDIENHVRELYAHESEDYIQFTILQWGSYALRDKMAEEVIEAMEKEIKRSL